jgi:low temperature requirement protein LtrA
MNEWKQIFGILLILIAVLPFIWWGQIWFRNSVQTRGRVRSLLLLLAIVFAAFLFIVVWPRNF